MGEVTELIGVLLLARLVVGNASEIGLPFIKRFILRFICKQKSYNTPNSTSSQAHLEASDEDDEREERNRRQWSLDQVLGELELDGVADEYMEMVKEVFTI